MSRARARDRPCVETRREAGGPRVIDHGRKRGKTSSIDGFAMTADEEKNRREISEGEWTSYKAKPRFCSFRLDGIDEWRREGGETV